MVFGCCIFFLLLLLFCIKTEKQVKQFYINKLIFIVPLKETPYLLHSMCIGTYTALYVYFEYNKYPSNGHRDK